MSVFRSTGSFSWFGGMLFTLALLLISGNDITPATYLDC